MLIYINQNSKKKTLEMSTMDRKSVLNKNFTEFCNNSTIHGLKYIGQNKDKKRTLWMVIVGLLSFVSAPFIYKAVENLLNSSLVLLLDQKESPISELQFPAVTICSHGMYNRNQNNYSDYLMRFNDAEIFELTSKFYLPDLNTYLYSIQRNIHDISVFQTNNKIAEYLLPEHLQLTLCKGIMKEYDAGWDCNLHFTRIWTKKGLCYSFNMLPLNKIFNPNVNYPSALHLNRVLPENDARKSNATEMIMDNLEQKLPIHVRNRRERLHVRVRLFDDFTDPICHPEFYVFIHNPYEIPWDLHTQGHHINALNLKKNIFSITPTVTRTKDELRKFSVEDRGCYFDKERPLKYFQRYSHSNCELECITDAFLADWSQLNCTLHWMPRLPDKKLCNYEPYLYASFIVDVSRLQIDECNCLPDCNSIKYDVKITQSSFNDHTFHSKRLSFKEMFKMYLSMIKKLKLSMTFDEFVKVIKESNLTVDFDFWKHTFTQIEVGFGSSRFLGMHRQLSYTFTDFISQIGGILGCFLGISFFSIVEVIYFFVIKLFHKVKKNHEIRQQESKKTDQICFLEKIGQQILHRKLITLLYNYEIFMNPDLSQNVSSIY
uniref:CSON004574 protein n=1 Tax=Culicoides sonorensis TaxID=179676 RepID=A0A336L5A7_CULSO